jgi:hypothetical protein
MSNPEETAGNGETEASPPYGLKQLATLNRREHVALAMMQSLLRHQAPGARRENAKRLAAEAFEIADVFLAEANGES